MSDLEQKLLDHVETPNYMPVKPRVIAKQLGLSTDQVPELRRVIKRLIRAGKLQYGSKHLVKRVDPNQKSKPATEATGIFRRTSSGYGFVTPSHTTRAAGRSEDVYIPQNKSHDASTGDLVRYRVDRRRGREGRLRGEIVEVVERDTHRFVGTFYIRNGEGVVHVDGNLFSQPIPVGDPGAKNVAENDKVVIELVRFPSHLQVGEGVVIEVLGPRGAPGVDTLSIIREYNLPDEFSEDVLDDARRQAEAFDEAIQEGRRDLTKLTVITIDPADARDFDDAISLEQLDNGHWLLGVHIADVTHFVPRKSPLDKEARDRATSVYLPDRVIPMLPEVISNHLASLQPGRVRYTRTAFIEFTDEGVRVTTEVVRGAIRSAHRFNYEEVDQYLADAEPWRTKLTPQVFALMARMHRLAMTLRRRRLDGGAIELTMPEIKIDLGKDGKVAGAHLVKHTESHQIIEEFMLAANEAVAEHLSDRSIKLLRRVHEAPDPRKLRALTQFVRELGFDCESLESRFEIKRVLKLVAGRPEQHAVNYAVLRSMQKAVYSPDEIGHYALHSVNYCHFTSPIRRYPDLTVHRMLDDLDHGRHPDDELNSQIMLGQHCSEREQRAEAAERELIKVKLLDHLSHRIGRKMEAIITGVEEFGLFAQGVELPAEGLIHISTLQDDYYHYDATTHSLTGRKGGNRYRLGDVVQVEIAHVDIDRRELDLRVIKRLKTAEGPVRTSQAGKAGKSGKRSSKKEQAKSGRSKTAKAAGKKKGKAKRRGKK